MKEPPASKTSGRPDGLRADAARNRAQVLTAARRLLTEGDERLSMNTIARDAGVGVGTVYRHFPTRQALLEGLAQNSLEVLVRETRQAGGDPDPAVAFGRMLKAALQGQLEETALAIILAAADFECIRTLDLARELGDAVDHVLRRACQAGVIRAGVSPEDIRRLLSGTCHAVRAGTDGTEQADRYLEVLLRGLRP